MGMILLLPFLSPVLMAYDTHAQLSAACAAVCQRTEEIVVEGEEILNNGVFSRKYLQGRSQVLAGKVACISVEDAVHCKDGCSALQERLHCTAGTVALHCV